MKVYRHEGFTIKKGTGGWIIRKVGDKFLNKFVPAIKHGKYKTKKEAEKVIERIVKNERA